MAANVRVNQSVLEVVVLEFPNVRICQSVIEFVTLPLPVVITCGNPPAGTVGASYTHAFPTVDGATPYTFSIVGGAVPTGLTIDTSTGVLSGAPRVSGTFPFTVQVTDASLNSSQATCSIVIAPFLVQPISGGGPPAILCPRPINLYDLCAEDEVRRTKGIHFPKACNIPECLLPWDEDYTPVPAGGVPFNVFGTIETPAPAAGDVLVCSGRVPHGYDALLTEIYQIYQGSGFQQGSGDIVWRIRRNQIWVKTLGNMPYSLGTPKSPVWLTQGEIMFSGTQFFFFVNVPNLSSMIQVGASTISCGMRGFYWPRG